MIPCRQTTSMRAGRCHQSGPKPREMSDRPVGKAPRQVVGRSRNSRWPSLSVQSLSCIQQVGIGGRLRHLLVVLVDALIQQSGIGSGRPEQRSKKFGVVRHSDAPATFSASALPRHLDHKSKVGCDSGSLPTIFCQGSTFWRCEHRNPGDDVTTLVSVYSFDVSINESALALTVQIQSIHTHYSYVPLRPLGLGIPNSHYFPCNRILIHDTQLLACIRANKATDRNPNIDHR